MTSYNIEVTEAELDVVRLALGRMVTPKPIRAKRATAKHSAVKLPTLGKVARLSGESFLTIAGLWAGAVKDPTTWRAQLANRAAAATNRNAYDVEAAWGIK